MRFSSGEFIRSAGGLAQGFAGFLAGRVAQTSAGPLAGALAQTSAGFLAGRLARRSAQCAHQRTHALTHERTHGNANTYRVPPRPVAAGRSLMAAAKPSATVESSTFSIPATTAPGQPPTPDRTATYCFPSGPR